MLAIELILMGEQHTRFSTLGGVAKIEEWNGVWAEGLEWRVDDEIVFGCDGWRYPNGVSC